MKNILYLFLLLLLLNSCNTDDKNYSHGVYDEDGTKSIQQLLFLLNAKTSDSSYLVVKSIDSINIYVNNYKWSKLNSEEIDVVNIPKYTVGNMSQTNQKLSYLLVADKSSESFSLNTAGEYADYLNGYFDLNQGEYVCLIQSFQVTFNDGTTKKFYPYAYRSFKVEENMQSLYVGEIDLNIY
jgi:hypothetical protein